MFSRVALQTTVQLFFALIPTRIKWSNIETGSPRVSSNPSIIYQHSEESFIRLLTRSSAFFLSIYSKQVGYDLVPILRKRWYTSWLWCFRDNPKLFCNNFRIFLLETFWNFYQLFIISELKRFDPFSKLPSFHRTIFLGRHGVYHARIH